jgi:uncharacterized repeat protein (TIGR01451 family)
MNPLACRTAVALCWLLPATAGFAATTFHPRGGGAPEIVASLTDSLQVDHNGDGLVNAGDTVRYTAVVFNQGGADAPGTLFSTGVDPNSTLVVGSVTTTLGTVTSGNNPGDSSVGVDIGTLPADVGTFTVVFDVTVVDPLPEGVTQLSCQGLVDGDIIAIQVTDDPDTPELDDPTITPLQLTPPSPILAATLTDELFITADDSTPTIAGPGDTIRYTATLTNSGNGAATAVVFAVAPVVHAPLAAGTVTTSQGTVTTGNAPGDTQVEIDLSSVAPNAVVVITFQVKIDDPLPLEVTELLCQGLITGDNHPALLTDDPDFPGPADPTRTAVEQGPFLPLVDIPALDSLGLALLALLLSGFALWHLRRSRPGMR